MPVEATAASDADMRTLLPISTTGFALFDLRQLRVSAWAAPVLKAFDEVGSAANPGLRWGLETLVDMDVWLPFRVRSDLRGEARLDLFRGEVDRRAIEQAFGDRRPNVRPTRFGTTEGVWDGVDAVVFPTSRTVLAGPAWAVRLTCRVVRGVDTSIVDEPWISDAAFALKEESAQADPDPAIDLMGRPTPADRADLKGILPAAVDLQWLGVRVHLGSDATLTAVGRTPSPDNARGLARNLNQSISSFVSRPGLAELEIEPVLEQIEIKPTGARAVVRVRASNEHRVMVADVLAKWSKALARQ